jgi:transcriptional regulator with XRE-family HTH domain
MKGEYAMLKNNIKELRIMKNFTTKEIASWLNVDENTLLEWENNEKQPDLKTISRIADIFNTGIYSLIGDTITVNKNYYGGQVPEHCCPICGYNYIHLEKVLPIEFNNSKSSGYAMLFWGECDHYFYIISEDYKGNSYMTYTDENFNIIKPVIPEQH